MSRTVIMAHRANLRGPEPLAENTLAACASALNHDLGLELDLRRSPCGQFYIGHDPGPWTEQNSLQSFSPLLSRLPPVEIAVNVKELGYEMELIDLMNSGAFGGKSFYFDFELLQREAAGEAQRRLHRDGEGRIRMGARLSDRGESLQQCVAIPADIVWADEFDSFWITRDVVERVKAAGRLFYVISPELHGFADDAVRRRWADFKSWKVDGVCTDYALDALSYFV